MTLSGLAPAETSIYDVKTKYAAQIGMDGQQDKIKLLLNKKPAADLKTLSELGVTSEDGSVEFGVMIIGGGAAGTPRSVTPAANSPAPTPAETPRGDVMDVDSTTAAAPPVAVGAPESEKAQMEVDSKTTEAETGTAAILKSDEFWSDLQGFLAQRLRDEGESERLAALFRKSVV